MALLCPAGAVHASAEFGELVAGAAGVWVVPRGEMQVA